MSAHWWLAVRYASWVFLAAISVIGVIWFYYGETYAWALGYGVAIGLVSFVSTALSVSMITGRSQVWRAVGAASFAGRYAFAAAALGVPAYLGLWPAVAMLAGFAGVYLAENVALLPGMVGAVSRRPAVERKPVERRAAI